MSSPLSERLEREFGNAIELLAPTATDSIDGVNPQLIAAPRDEEAARTLVTLCGREGWAFVPVGNRTKIGIGAPPSKLDLLISTRHLNHILDHDEGNATVEAGAGISLAQLNRIVGEQRQFVPLDDEGGTLGGSVACNGFGPSRLKWGTPRDLVTGLSVALSDGRLVKGGAKVVKNVSGYDLPKIFTGSFGTLGLLTRITIRLRPNDAARADWSKSFASWGELTQTATEFSNGPFEPTFIRALSAGNNLQLFARFEGGEKAVAAQLEKLPPSDSVTFPSLQGEWQMRAHLPITLAGDWAHQAAEDSGKVVWDCASGIARASWNQATVATLENLRAAALKVGGFAFVEAAPYEIKTPDFIWGIPRADFALMKKLKEAYDEANVCSPGRFVGGL